MVNANLNYFDMAVYAIMFLSCLFAFFRGFVKEILSLIAWIGAAFITVRYFPQVSEKLQPHFSKPLVAAAVATLSLYFGSLIAFAIFNRIIIKLLKSGSEIGWFDNFLGLAFGALRGAFIISLGYLMVSVVIKDDSKPVWLEKAVTRPYVEKGAVILANIAPKYIEELSNMQKNVKDGVGKSSSEATVTLDKNAIGRLQEELKEDTNKVEEGTKETSGSFEQFLKNIGKK